MAFIGAEGAACRGGTVAAAWVCAERERKREIERGRGVCVRGREEEVERGRGGLKAAASSIQHAMCPPGPAKHSNQSI